jgi:hypothetical protein
MLASQVWPATKFVMAAHVNTLGFPQKQNVNALSLVDLN